ncbi:MAG: hypothetical protein RL885_32995 [Planctomycetota bacterium]
MPTDDEIMEQLIGIIVDGFNRSLAVLRSARAVDTSVMDEHYSGIGSQYYDLVTEQIQLTAEAGVEAIRDLFRQGGDNRDRTGDA